jgi:hypothetical protein
MRRHYRTKYEGQATAVAILNDYEVAPESGYLRSSVGYNSEDRDKQQKRHRARDVLVQYRI